MVWFHYKIFGFLFNCDSTNVTWLMVTNVPELSCPVVMPHNIYEYAHKRMKRFHSVPQNYEGSERTIRPVVRFYIII